MKHYLLLFGLTVFLSSAHAYLSPTGVNATKLQGVPVSSATPADTNCLAYDAGSGQWAPAVCSGGGGITALTGDVTASGSGSVAATIAANAVSNAKLATVATATFKGRATAGTGSVENLTATQATALLDSFVGDSGSGGTKGLVPAPSTGDASKFLKGDGTWATAGGATKTSAVYTNFTATFISGAETTVTANNAVSNVGSAFNTATGVFTVPTTGLYYVAASFQSDTGAGAGGAQLDLSMVINGSTVILMQEVHYAASIAAPTIQAARYWPFTAGDTVKLNLFQSGFGGNIGGENFEKLSFVTFYGPF